MRHHLTELEAVEVIARRGSRLAVMIALPMVIGAVLIGVAAYLLLRADQLAKNDVHFPVVTAGIGFGAPMAIALVIARLVSRWAVRTRRPAWIEEVAAQNALDRDTLAESFGSWN